MRLGLRALIFWLGVGCAPQAMAPGVEPALPAKPFGVAPRPRDDAPAPIAENDAQLDAFWSEKARRSSPLFVEADVARARPAEERCSTAYAGPSWVSRAFAPGDAAEVHIRAELADCIRVERVAADSPITVAGRASGGAGGYHGAGGTTSARYWGLSFEARRLGNKLIISTFNEIDYIHHHYYLDALVLKVPKGISVVLTPRKLDGDGAADLDESPRGSVSR